MTALVCAEHDGHQLSGQTARTVTAALQIDPDVHVLVAGSGVSPVAGMAAALAGVSQVLVADDPQFAGNLPEALAAQVMATGAGYGALLAPATVTWKSVMPRVAALLDVMQVSEIVEVIDPETFRRPIYAGNAIQTVRCRSAVKVVTVRPTAFEPARPGDSAPVSAVAVATDPGLSAFVSQELTGSERPELTSARVVVSGGRAFGSAEQFNALLTPVADRLNAALGASRAAVDAGYAPSDWQVGQTGKIVAPDVYVACGISGAIQHLAGMKESRVVVAINMDAEAPIFQVADYGLVGDLFDILPQLAEQLPAR